MKNQRYFRVITSTLPEGLLFDTYTEAYKFSEIESSQGYTCCVDEVTISFPGGKVEVVK